MANEKKLKRSSNKMLAGVCAGLAEYFNMDVTLMRVLYACLSVIAVGFLGIIVYIILMIIMPNAEE